jgi:hypothetical protein
MLCRGNGRRFKTTYPNDTAVERAFTDRGELHTTKYGSNIVDTRTYDDGGRLGTSADNDSGKTNYPLR